MVQTYDGQTQTYWKASGVSVGDVKLCDQKQLPYRYSTCATDGNRFRAVKRASGVSNVGISRARKRHPRSLARAQNRRAPKGPADGAARAGRGAPAVQPRAWALASSVAYVQLGAPVPSEVTARPAIPLCLSARGPNCAPRQRQCRKDK